MVFFKANVGFTALFKVFGQLLDFSQQVVSLDDPDASTKSSTASVRVFVLFLPVFGILERLLLHAPGDEQDDPDDDQRGQANPDVKE